MADRHTDRLADDLCLGDAALRGSPLDRHLQVLRQVQRRLLHSCMVPPVVPPLANGWEEPNGRLNLGGQALRTHGPVCM